MNRSEYVDADSEEARKWRGKVNAAIRSKKGQAFLRELEEALLALPRKALIPNSIAKDGCVCAFGAVAVFRKIKCAGKTFEEALREIEESYGGEDQGDPDFPAELAVGILGAPDALARELMAVNDDSGKYLQESGQRYLEVLSWVRTKLRPSNNIERSHS